MHAFDVLGDPVRRRILELLADGEQPLGRGRRASSRPSSGSPSPRSRSTSGCCARTGSRPCAPRAPAGSTPSTPAAARRRRLARPLPRGSGRRPSTRSRPRSPAASAAPAHVRPRQEDAMIDVIQRDQRVTAPRRRAACSRPARRAASTISQVYDTDARRPVGRVHQPRAHPALVPARLRASSELGGRYQLEGNAGGAIERCDPPRSFAATWEYGGDVELDRGAADARGRRPDALRARAHRARRRRALGAVRSRRRRHRLGSRLIGLARHLASGRRSIPPPVSRGWRRTTASSS